MNDESSPTPESAELLRDRIKRALKAKRRLAAVERLDLLDSAHSVPALNRAARIAARAMRAPIAQVNILTERELVPIAAFVAPGSSELDWTSPRRAGHSLCKFVLLRRGPLAIENAREDPLVMNASATAELEIGAYLGAPIRAESPDTRLGAILGTVCVMDHEPRNWSAEDIATIADIASAVSEQIAFRMRQRRAMHDAGQELTRILAHIAVGVLATDANGVVTFANSAAAALLGYSQAELVGHDQHALIHHSRADGSRFPENECPHYLARRGGWTHREEHDVFWRPDGTSVTVSTTMVPILERGEVIGSVVTFMDASDQHAREGRAKSEVLRAIAQELSEPLEMIDANAAQLEATISNDELRAIRSGQRQIAEAIRTLAGLMSS